MMREAIRGWIEASREKLGTGTLGEGDLQRLETLVAEPTQRILYLYSRSTNMRARIIGWVLYDPTCPDEPKLPSQDSPYPSVIDAVRDGWRIVQFPIPELREFSEVDNRYLGYEFVLEKCETVANGQNGEKNG